MNIYQENAETSSSDVRDSNVAVKNQEINSDIDEVDDSDFVEISTISSNISVNPQDVVSLENFEILKFLGYGTYGRVFLVRKRDGFDEGVLYALKIINKIKVTETLKTTGHTKSEREVLEKVIDCPFLAKMFYAFQTPEKLYIVLEFAQGGELFTHVSKAGHFSEQDVQFYIAEIIVAIEQLHALKIIYRDIKTENILLDKFGHIVITDFGLTKQLKNRGRAYSFCGTHEYMAPEIVGKKKTGHDLNVDWWSVGILTIELLTGKSPFLHDGEELSEEPIRQEVMLERIMTENPNIPETIGEDARDFITKLLSKVPKKRLGFKNGAKELKEHRFLKDIDWQKLAKKELEAPKPFIINCKDDVSQFDEEFTDKKAEDVPCAAPTGKNASKYFRGYSFVCAEGRSNAIKIQSLGRQKTAKNGVASNSGNVLSERNEGSSISSREENDFQLENIHNVDGQESKLDQTDYENNDIPMTEIDQEKNDVCLNDAEENVPLIFPDIYIENPVAGLEESEFLSVGLWHDLLRSIFDSRQTVPLIQSNFVDSIKKSKENQVSKRTTKKVAQTSVIRFTRGNKQKNEEFEGPAKKRQKKLTLEQTVEILPDVKIVEPPVRIHRSRIIERSIQKHLKTGVEDLEILKSAPMQKFSSQALVDSSQPEENQVNMRTPDHLIMEIPSFSAAKNSTAIKYFIIGIPTKQVVRCNSMIIERHSYIRPKPAKNA